MIRAFSGRYLRADYSKAFFQIYAYFQRFPESIFYAYLQRFPESILPFGITF